MLTDSHIPGVDDDDLGTINAPALGWIDSINWVTAKAGSAPPPASDVALTEVKMLQCDANGHLDTVANGSKALISCLAVIYDYADRYRDNLQTVLSVLASHQIRPTKATVKSPMLPFVKLIIPKVDPKAASLYARALGHAAAEGVASDKLVEFVGKTGGIEACARQYARSRRGEQTAAPKASRPIDKMRTIAASALPSTIPMPRESGLYILVVERRPNGEAVSYGCTDDPSLVDRAASRIVRSEAATAK